MTELLEVRECFQLPGILTERHVILNMTMGSDKFICGRGLFGLRTYVLDFLDPENYLDLPFSTGSQNGKLAVMNPNGRMIALTNGSIVSIWDIGVQLKSPLTFWTDSKSEYKGINQTTVFENVVFLKWITVDILSVVTDEAVYHWYVADSLPEKIFMRDDSMCGFILTDYNVGLDDKWCLLVGYSQGRWEGQMQLYSREDKESQLIKARAGSFFQFRMDGNEEFSNLLCYATDKKLHIVEVDTPSITSAPYVERVMDIFFDSKVKREEDSLFASYLEDHPISLHPILKYGMVYLITLYGFCHLYDIDSAQCLYMGRVSTSCICNTVLCKELNGVVCVNEKGKVISVGITEQNIIPYLMGTIRDSKLGVRYGVRYHISDLLKYLVQQKNFETWTSFLGGDTLLSGTEDALLHTPIPGVDLPDHVSVAVQAFLFAHLPCELSMILERIILANPPLKTNNDIQNLLILAAMKAGKRASLMEYVTCFDHYSDIEILRVAFDKGMYEEACAILRKFKRSDNVDLFRSEMRTSSNLRAFVEKCGDPYILSMVGRYLMEEGKIREALKCLTDARDVSEYVKVINSAKSAGCFAEVRDYLTMACMSMSNTHVDEELILALAQTNSLDRLDSFLGTHPDVDLQAVGQQCHQQGLYEAAELIRDKWKNGPGGNSAHFTSTVATSSNSKPIDAVADILECKICLGRLKKPKMLACEHMFCMTCLESILSFSDEGSAVIACPLRCCTSTTISATQTLRDLGTPYEVKAIISTLNLSESKIEDTLISGGCCYTWDCNKDISTYCCGRMMCEYCLEKHDRSDTTHRGRYSVVVERAEKKMEVICKDHWSKCTQLCLDACHGGRTRFLCNYCMNRGHKGHTMGPIVEQVSELKEAILAGSNANRDVVHVTGITEEHIASCKDKLSKLLHGRTKKRVLKYLEELMKEEEVILKELDDAADQHLLQYPVPLDECYYENKLRKNGAELLTEKQEILQTIAEHNLQQLSLRHNSISITHETETHPLGKLEITESGPPHMPSDLLESPFKDELGDEEVSYSPQNDAMVRIREIVQDFTISDDSAAEKKPPKNRDDTTATATFGNSGKEPYHLPFNVGDTITNVRKLSEGWYFGECKGIAGVFYGHFVSFHQ